MDEFREKQNKSCGVGGLRCDCCNDFHGKDRAILNRIARRRLKSETENEVNEDILDSNKES